MFTADQIISYQEMTFFEQMSLQAGMNFRLPPNTSVFLMSTRKGAPYNDRIEDEGRTLIYEGHDVPRTRATPDPKSVNQVLETNTGTLTQNGKFHQAALRHKTEGDAPIPIRVYQKLKPGIWAFNGTYSLIDAWPEKSGRRSVYKFKLTLFSPYAEGGVPESNPDIPQTRMIPSEVKLFVYQRDAGKCVLCGVSDNLHFDHDLPYSKGGTSLIAENIRLLCARHNLSKGARIQ